MFRHLYAAFLCLLVPGSAAGSEALVWRDVAPRGAPLTVGAQTHFGEIVERAGYRRDAAERMMAQAGFTAWRDSVSWPRWELRKAGSSTEQEHFETLRLFANDSQFTAPGILTFSGAPRQVQGLGLAGASRRYGDFVGEAVRPFPKSAMIELWNEWDKGSSFSPQGRAGDYIAFIRGALGEIRAAAPGRRVLIGAAADSEGQLRFEWTRQLVDAGLLAQADGLSVHVYDYCSPSRSLRSAADMIGRLDDLRGFLVQAGQGAKPVYVSEFGWPTGSGKCLIDPDNVASNLAQFVLLSATRPWISGIWAYELKDSGRDPTAREHRFGLNDYDGTPKPAVCAARDAIGLLREGTVTGQAFNTRIAGIALTLRGAKRTVLWAQSHGDPVVIQLDRPVVARALCGAAKTLPAGPYRLGSRPVLFDGELLR